MKFTTKFLLIYLTITVIVLGAGGYISYYIIQEELNDELTWRLLDRVHRVTHLLKRGKDFRSAMISGAGEANLSVRQLPERVEETTSLNDTLVWDRRLEQMQPNLKLTAYRTVEDTSYFISTYGTLVETDDITEAVSEILFWILMMQIIGAIIISAIISTRLFEPLRKTIKKIKLFDIQDKKPIAAEPTSVKEFNDLNMFVEQMTKKAVNDYESLKEFAENASHELKTPLAISRGKLELLAETPLNKQQLQYTEDAQRSISNLSKLSTSLALLTKIENEEFFDKNVINLTELIKKSISAFGELINLKKLNLTTKLDAGVKAHMHHSLADIMWSNLFQNAIKHNTENGFIKIELTDEWLEITNPGPPLDGEPNEYFNRFKKSNPASDSAGLGLAIVKRIADQNDFKLKYRFDNSVHTLKVEFNRPD